MSSEVPVVDKAGAADIDAVRAILKQTSAYPGPPPSPTAPRAPHHARGRPPPPSPPAPAAVLQLRQELKALSDEQPSVTKDQLLQAIIDNGAAETPAEAQRLFQAMQDLAVVFLYKDVVYLRPKDVAGQVMDLLPGAHMTYDEVTAQAAELEARLAPLQREMDRVCAAAEARAKRTLASFVAALGAQLYLFYWLIYDESSWDVMEPVTYFTTVGLTIVGYAYSLRVGRDWHYDNLWSRMTRKYVERGLRRARFPRDEYDALVAELSRLQRRQDLAQLVPHVAMHAHPQHAQRAIRESLARRFQVPAPPPVVPRAKGGGPLPYMPVSAALAKGGAHA